VAKPKIAVVIGTTRATRFGEKPAKWIHAIAAARGDMSVELVDLREYPISDQLDFLCAQHCDEMQGFYFARPLPVDDCTRTLADGRRLGTSG
jgi:predicted signal transduction protein with EAL and GGDEF domain